MVMIYCDGRGSRWRVLLQRLHLNRVYVYISEGKVYLEKTLIRGQSLYSVVKRPSL